MSEIVDHNCLSWWFPRLQASGVAVPRTEIVRTDVPLHEVLDGRQPGGYEAFLAELRAAVLRLGTPCFLRTGQGSGKHRWNRCCCVRSVVNLPLHVAALVEWSEMVDFFGLPTKVWAVREWLDLEAPIVATAYGDRPVARERRYFFHEGQVLCHHPYWPRRAVAEGKPGVVGWQLQLKLLNEEDPAEVEELSALTRQAAAQFLGQGYFSLDWAKTRDGRWVAIDMARGEQSFHWEGCLARP